jgi:hypothetical protein
MSKTYTLKAASLRLQARARTLPEAAWQKLPAHLAAAYEPSKPQERRVLPGIGPVPRGMIVSMGALPAEMRAHLMAQAKKGI